MLLRSALLALAGLVIAASCLPAQEIPQPIRILLITGGCCHDYDAQKQLIAKGLEARALVDVEVVQQGGSATDSKIEVYERENWAEGYDLVIHDECFSDVKDRAWVDNILKPHRAGLPGVVIHCAMHCYRDGREDWFKFCGVTSHRHGAHYAHEVLNRDAGHPIMQGFPAGWANPAGELYWIEKLGEHTHALAAAQSMMFRSVARQRSTSMLPVNRRSLTAEPTGVEDSCGSESTCRCDRQGNFAFFDAPRRIG